jgi:hypothetical protein
MIGSDVNVGFTPEAIPRLSALLVSIALGHGSVGQPLILLPLQRLYFGAVSIDAENAHTLCAKK